MTIKSIRPLFFTLFCTWASIPGFGQNAPPGHEPYDNLSMEDLLNVKIVSVSKTSEFLFDASLSASVITKAEISRAGSTSIMEALRLVPGVIVREQSNGNYDIHLRGMDNVPPSASFDIASTTTLVMIKNRPIYSFLRGGTFWETLPVDLNDIEKIEVIRGPAAALYGPNAVNGVINIITGDASKAGFYTAANARQGSFSSFINNASVGYQSQKFGAVLSGNYQLRKRTQDNYFEFNRNRWLEDNPPFFINFTNDTVRNVGTRYPDPGLSMKKYAGNVFLEYHPAEDSHFYLATGAQHSMVQKVSTENEITPLSTAASSSHYIDVRATALGISSQLSFNSGTQVTDYDPGNKYDFSTFDGNIEYDFTRKNFSLKPGLSYRSAVYDDRLYSDITNKAGIFNTKGQITTKSASLRGEYKLRGDRLRLVSGLIASKFNYPDTTYISYEAALSYKLNDKNLFRAVYSRAPRSSTVFETFVDQTVSYFPSGPNRFTRIALQGNSNLKLLTAELFELGYRGKISTVLNIDIELFQIKARDYNIMVSARPYTETSGPVTTIVQPVVAMNLPLKMRQQGITASVTYSAGKLELRPFITLQRSRGEDYAPFYNTPDASWVAGASQNNIYSGAGEKIRLKSTPTVYGGGVANYRVSPRFNINVSSYYYTSQIYSHLSSVLLNDGIRGTDQIPAKLLINSNLLFTPVNGVQFSLTGKNLLNETSREFFRADQVPFTLFGGIHYQL